jgi:hypothetical protein
MKRVAWILMLVLGYLTLEGNFARAETPLDVGRWLNYASAELGLAPKIKASPSLMAQPGPAIPKLTDWLTTA